VQGVRPLLKKSLEYYCSVAAALCRTDRGLGFRFCVQRTLFGVCGSAFSAAFHIKINQYSHGAYIAWSTLTTDAQRSSEMLAANYQTKRKHIWCVCSLPAHSVRYYAQGGRPNLFLN